jgi:hypothetical protein
MRVLPSRFASRSSIAIRAIRLWPCSANIARSRLFKKREFMVEALSLVARSKYGDGEFIIDGVMRQIPDHCHMHARPTRWRN